MKIGAHVSTAGGIINALATGQQISCETIQIFESPPLTLAFKPVTGEQIELFKQGLADTGIGPVFLHVIGTASKENLQKAKDSYPDEPVLALENMAGMGRHIRARFDELGNILKAMDSPRLEICLDTQHSLAAGYDPTSPQGISTILGELDAEP